VQSLSNLRTRKQELNLLHYQIIQLRPNFYGGVGLNDEDATRFFLENEVIPELDSSGKSDGRVSPTRKKLRNKEMIVCNSKWKSFGRPG